MMWYIQPLLDWLSSAQGSNLIAAACALALLCGACPRRMLVLTVLLHLLMAAG